MLNHDDENDRLLIQRPVARDVRPYAKFYTWGGGRLEVVRELSALRKV